MADPQAPETKPAKAKFSDRYFETLIDGLSIATGDNNRDGASDPGMLTSVRATRYTKKYQGDRVRVGIFVITAETPKRVLEVLLTDSNVTELTEDQYKAIVNDRDTKRVG